MAQTYGTFNGGLSSGGGTAVAAGINALYGMWQQHYAAEQADWDRTENYRYNELAAENADARTRALYNDFYSPEALMRQYKAAGLSPSMMFGGTPGQGGTSGAMGAGAHGPQTMFSPSSLVDAAQAAALFAQAEKTKEETKTEAGENAKGYQIIANLMADTGNKDASTAYTKAATIGEEIANKLNTESYDFQLSNYKHQAEMLKWQAETAMYESWSANAKSQVDKATVETNIDIAKQTYKDLIASTCLKWSQKDLTEQQIKESETKIWTMIEHINIDWVNALANETNAEANKEFIDAKIPYIAKELEIEAKRLGVEKTKVWVDGVTRSIEGISFMIMAGSKVGQLGKGGLEQPDIKTMQPVNTKGKPTFKTQKQKYGGY